MTLDQTDHHQSLNYTASRHLPPEESVLQEVPANRVLKNNILSSHNDLTKQIQDKQKHLKWHPFIYPAHNKLHPVKKDPANKIYFVQNKMVEQGTLRKPLKVQPKNLEACRNLSRHPT